MAGWDGNGNVTLTHDWTDDRDAAVKITASRMDTQFEDLRSSVENTIAKDGQNVPTADLPMGGQKHTGAGDGTARNHYATVGQVQDQDNLFVAAGGTVDALTATYSPAITALVDGMEIAVRASGANTSTTPTLNINAIGAKTITKLGNQALLVGDIRGAGHEMRLRYHSSGDRWELLNPAAVITPADLLDEDDMSSDSATAAPTQQSTKAYVDSAGWKRISITTFSSTANLEVPLLATYKQYKIVLEMCLPSGANAELNLLVSDDDGSTYESANYHWSKLQVFGTTVSGTVGNSDTDFDLTGNLLSATAGQEFSGEIKIMQHATATSQLHVSSEIYASSGGSPYSLRTLGRYEVDADIDKIKLDFAGGENFASGTATVYGLVA